MCAQLRERRQAERRSREAALEAELADTDAPFDVDLAPELNAGRSKRELAAEAANDDIVRTHSLHIFFRVWPCACIPCVLWVSC